MWKTFHSVFIFFIFHFSQTPFQRNRTSRVLFIACSRLQGEFCSASRWMWSTFKLQVTIRNNPQTFFLVFFFFGPAVLDEAKAETIIVSLLLHTSVPLACQYFPPLSAPVQQVLRCGAEPTPQRLVFFFPPRTSFRMCPVSVTAACESWAGFDIEVFFFFQTAHVNCPSNPWNKKLQRSVCYVAAESISSSIRSEKRFFQKKKKKAERGDAGKHRRGIIACKCTLWRR